jgi:hypothetical protein
LGSDFDGVIIFDESHAMQNAGWRQGRTRRPGGLAAGPCGLAPAARPADARVVYVSATGATTVHNLAYAQRLGLWGGEDFPFATRAEFVEAIEAGGVAAMEVLARDLKALGLYAARSLSYDGVEYELVEHQLTDEQPHLRRLCRRLRRHPQQSRRRAGGDQRHRRNRHAEPAGQVGRALGLRERQAAFLQSPASRR